MFIDEYHCVQICAAKYFILYLYFPKSSFQIDEAILN